MFSCVCDGVGGNYFIIVNIIIIIVVDVVVVVSVCSCVNNVNVEKKINLFGKRKYEFIVCCLQWNNGKYLIKLIHLIKFCRQKFVVKQSIPHLLLVMWDFVVYAYYFII